MNIYFKFSCVVVFSLIVLIAKPSVAKEKMLVLSAQKAEISAIQVGFSEKYEISWVSNTNKVNINNARLLMIIGEKTLPPEFRRPIHNFIKSRGNIIFIGARPLNYIPQAINPISVVSFDNDYDVVYPKRKLIAGSVDQPTIKQVSSENTQGLQFITINRGMKDVMLGIPLKGKALEKRNVISFKAKGSHFMDLLAFRS